MDPNSATSAEERARWDNYRNFGDDLPPREEPTESARWNFMKQVFEAKLKRDEWSQRPTAECFDGGDDDDYEEEILKEASAASQYAETGEEEEDPEPVPQEETESQWHNYAKQERGILLDLDVDEVQPVSPSLKMGGWSMKVYVNEDMDPAAGY